MKQRCKLYEENTSVTALTPYGGMCLIVKSIRQQVQEMANKYGHDVPHIKKFLAILNNELRRAKRQKDKINRQ